VKSKASCGNKEACKVKRDASKKKCGSDKAKGTHGEFMSKADTNKDGKLSMKEFRASHMKRMKSQFKMMDTDGDGFLTEADREGKGKKCKSEKKKKGKKKEEA
jgi:Ca2+-binding EF-hand superfamily protein